MKTLFSKIIDGELPSYPIYEDEDIFVFLDAFPATKGHCLVVPKEPTEDVLSADPHVVARCNIVAQAIAKASLEALGATGVNILTNAGEVSGQTVEHYHVHIIPRYTKEELQFVHEQNQADKADVQSVYQSALASLKA